MGTRKNNKKSNKRFRKTRSKRQRGGGGIFSSNKDDDDEVEHKMGREIAKYLGGKRKTRKSRKSKRKTRKSKRKTRSKRQRGGVDTPPNEESGLCGNCSICLEPMNNVNNLIATDCNHTFHKDCLREVCSRSSSPINKSCPICRRNIVDTCRQLIALHTPPGTPPAPAPPAPVPPVPPVPAMTRGTRPWESTVVGQASDDVVARVARIRAMDEHELFETEEFVGADLQGADLRGIARAPRHLQGANLRGANLTSANLEGANLRNANLTDTIIFATRTRDANLEGTRLALGYEETESEQESLASTESESESEPESESRPVYNYRNGGKRKTRKSKRKTRKSKRKTRKSKRKTRKSKKSKRKTRSKRGGSGKGKSIKKKRGEEIPLPPSTSNPLPPIPPTTSPGPKKISSNEKEEEEEIDTCPICFDDTSEDDPSCENGHHIHRKCLLGWCQSKEFKNVKCPVCRKDITSNCIQAQEEEKKIRRAQGEVFNSKNIFVYIELIKRLQKEQGNGWGDIETLQNNKEDCIHLMYEILLNPMFDINVKDDDTNPNDWNEYKEKYEVPERPRNDDWLLGSDYSHSDDDGFPEEWRNDDEVLCRLSYISTHISPREQSNLNKIFKPAIEHLLQNSNIIVSDKVVLKIINYNKELIPLFKKYKKIPKHLKAAANAARV